MIEFEDARFTYDGEADALDGVSLRVEPGEFLCVLGGNGSGKSTLAKHVNALLTPDRGEVRVLGRDTRDTDSVYFIRSNAGMVFQNPDDQIVASIIEDDIAFGPENLGIENPELRERVTQALEQVGLQGFEKRETAALSGGQKQRVAIAGALAMQPRVLVLDEASAMLDPRGRAGLMRLCRELNEAGLTVVYITHFMEEAARADRVVVLDGGKVALDGTPVAVLTEVEQLERLRLDVPFPARMSRLLQERGIEARTCITTDDLTEELLRNQRGSEAREGGATRSSTTVPVGPGLAEARPVGPNPAGSSPAEACPARPNPAEAHALARGHEGASSGTTPPKRATPPNPRPQSAQPQSPLLQLENVSFAYEPTSRRERAERPASAPAKWGNSPDGRWALQNVSFEVGRGEFFGIAGHTGSGKSTLIQLAAGLLKPASGRVSIDGTPLTGKKAAREAAGKVGVVFQYPERQLFAATVFDDVAFGPRNLGLDPDEVEARVRAALDMVRLDASDLRDKSPFALSGGQQRRVAIAGVLAMEPQVLIMDEPTAGLDPQARAALFELIESLHESRDLTIVLVSHSMDDLARLCDRIALLNQGELIALGAPSEVFSNAAELKKIGLGTPHVLQLATALEIDTGSAIPSEPELADRIAAALRNHPALGQSTGCTQGSSGQGAPAHDGPGQGAPREGGPAQGDAREGAPRQGDSREDGPGQGAPAQDNSAQGAPAQNDPLAESEA